MQNLFIVQSPFQLLSAIEGANYFKGDENTLIISYTSEDKNNEQIRMALKYYPFWNEVIELAPSRYPIWAGLRLLFEAKRLNKSGYKATRVFIGEYRSQYMMQFFRSMNPQECFLLDDGNITIELQEKYLKENKLYGGDSFKSSVKKWLLTLLSGTKQDREILVHLFTCFDLQPFDAHQLVIKHAFEFTKSPSMNKAVEQSTVFFFGCNFSGLGMLQIERELGLIAAVKLHYEKLNLRMIYIPHRRESEAKIKRIQTEVMLETIHFVYPAEIEIFRLAALPYGIASFFSTVLFTLPRICAFASVDAFSFPLSELPESYRSEIEQTYHEYGKTIRVIEIK